MENTLQFIKKTRPKLQVGDYFYYRINLQWYVGIIIQNDVYMNNTPNVKDAVNCCLLLNLHYENIVNINENEIKQCIIDKKLLLPPINLNKKGWTTGFFVKLGNISLDFAVTTLDLVRFVYGKNSIYTIDYNKTSDIPCIDLTAEIGVYAIEGFEALLQISLDLEFSSENPEWFNPYEYYEKIANNETLPFWYYKSKDRLNK